jgi:hypothetical protein
MDQSDFRMSPASNDAEALFRSSRDSRRRLSFVRPKTVILAPANEPPGSARGMIKGAGSSNLAFLPP